MFHWMNTVNQINARRAALREKAKLCPLCEMKSMRVSPYRSTREHCAYLWEIGESGERLDLRPVPGILDADPE